MIKALLFAAGLVLGQVRGGRDTTYGRIDGDLIVVAGAGVTTTARGPSAALELRARFLDTAGAFVTYEEGFGGPAEPTRALVFGAEIRPLFLGRWLTGREIGSAFFDLLIDSLGFDLGGALLQPKAGDFGDRVALQATVGLELPILGQASGPFLGVHGGGRFTDRGLAGERSALEQSGVFTVTLSWHQAIGTHAVDLRDARP